MAIIVIIVVAVVAYVLINHPPGGKKRSLVQRNVLDDLQMNTARAIEISTGSTAASQQPRSPDADTIVPLPRSRRRIHRVRSVALDVDAPEKRFVVDWQGIDPSGSD